MILAFRKSVLRCFIIGFVIANVCNAIRIICGDILRLQDYSLFISHDVMNYIFGSLALLLAYVGGNWWLVKCHVESTNSGTNIEPVKHH